MCMHAEDCSARLAWLTWSVNSTAGELPGAPGGQVQAAVHQAAGVRRLHQLGVCTPAAIVIGARERSAINLHKGPWLKVGGLIGL